MCASLSPRRLRQLRLCGCMLPLPEHTRGAGRGVSELIILLHCCGTPEGSSTPPRCVCHFDEHHAQAQCPALGWPGCWHGDPKPVSEYLGSNSGFIPAACECARCEAAGGDGCGTWVPATCVFPVLSSVWAWCQPLGILSHRLLKKKKRTASPVEHSG